MQGKGPFDQLCEQLEASTSFDRLEARGTVRLALKEAGLEAAKATSRELAVVVEKLFPKMLADRGIEEPTGVCDALGRALDALGPDTATPGQEGLASVFRRIR